MAQDNLGRDFDGGTAGRDFAEALLRQLPHAKPIIVQHTDTDRQVYHDIQVAVEDLEKKLEKQTDEEIDILQNILKEIQNQRKLQQTTTKKERLSSGSRDTNIATVINTSIDRSIKRVMRQNSGMRRNSTSGTFINDKDVIKNLGLGNIAAMVTSAVFMGLGKGIDTFVKNTGVELGAMFDGILKEEFQFSTGMKAIINETRQYGKEISKTQKEYLEFGLVTNETGFQRIKFQQAYMKSSRKGLIQEFRGNRLVALSIREQRSMLKSALSTARSIGSEAEATAEMFDNWQRSLTLSNSTLHQVGFSMRTIARETGVSGDNLLNAAKNSEQLFKIMKKVGGLTASTMSGIMRSQTLASKYGIEELTSTMDQGMVSFNEMLKMTDKNLQAFLMRAVHGANDTGAAFRALQSGTLLDEANIGIKNNAVSKELSRNIQSSGLGEILLRQAEQSGMAVGEVPVANMSAMQMGEAIEKYVMPNMDQHLQMLTTSQMRAEQDGNIGLAQQLAQQKFQAEALLEQMTGMGIGQIGALSKKMSEESLTPDQRIAKLENQLAMTRGDGRKAIENDIAQINQDRIRSVIGQYSGVIQAGGNTDKALADAQTRGRSSGLFKDGSTLNMQGYNKMVGDSLGYLNTQLESFGVDVEELVQSKGFDSIKQVQDAMVYGKEDYNVAATEVHAALENALAVKQKSQDNPVEQIQDMVHSINDNIKAIAGSFIYKLTAGWLGTIIGGAIALKFAAGTIGANNAYRTVSNWWKGNKGIPSGVPSIGGGVKGLGGGTVANRRTNMSREDRMLQLNEKRVSRGQAPLSRTNIRRRGGKRGLANLLYTGLDLANSVTNVAAGNSGGNFSGYGDATPVYVVNFNEMNGGVSVANTALDALSVADTAGDLSRASKGKGFWGKTKGLFGFGDDVATGAAKSGWLGKAGRMAGKAGGPLAAVLGTVSGFMDEKRGGVEGAALGLLTGGADRGSMFSGMLGIEKGSAMDDIMGIGGSMAHGAAVGSVIPVVGTAVGAVVGGLTEVYKILTDPESSIGAAFQSVTGALWNGAKSIGSSIMGGVGAIAGTLWEGAKSFGSSILSGVGSIAGSLWEGAKGIGSFMLDSVSGIAETVAGGIGTLGASLWEGATSLGSMLTDKASGFWSWLTGGETPVESSAAGLGAFDGKTLVNEGTAEGLNAKLADQSVRLVDANMINTGAFAENAVKEISSLGENKDYNNVVDSVKERMVKGNLTGATKALYMTDNGTSDDLDEHLANSYMHNYSTSTTEVGASMFTPEDASDYIMQQIAGSVPTSASTSGSLEYLSKLQEEQNMLTIEMLEELRKLNNIRSSSMSGGGGYGGRSVRKDTTSSALTGYSRDKIRGSFTGIQAVPNNHQDNLEIRHP